MDRDDADAGRAQRAAARRANRFPGELVRAGTPKGLLYADLDPKQRLMAMSALCRAQWLASGGTLEVCPRETMPGEIFEIHHA